MKTSSLAALIVMALGMESVLADLPNSKGLVGSTDGRGTFGDVRLAEQVFSEDNAIVVDAENARFPVAEDLWGLFFEDINLSLDGGVFAELVRNRSFEDGAGCERWWVEARKHWETVGRAVLNIDTSHPLSPQNNHAACVTAEPGGGIANSGYFGMAIKAGESYRLSVVLRGDVKGPVEVSLEALGRPALAKAMVDEVSPDWRTNRLVLVASDDEPSAKLVFRAPGGGRFYLDSVSLFPEKTYGKSGLFRRDLMERLAALKPKFLRFPGGCWVEGETMDKAYRWKKTLGPAENRRPQWNIWEYWSSNAIGFHEFLLLCEELKAKPLFCINCGMSHKENVPMDKMAEYVQDALDAIEYANGPADSKWGAVRASNGHPEPFCLEYLEIGNENGGEAYEERYALIHDAVRARYPEVKIISNVWCGTVRHRPQHIRDEHFYGYPEWFMDIGARLFDAYPRGGFEVFVGEYAVIRGTGTMGSMRGAIAEAAFMCGMERNSDIVKLAAYAPLVANRDHLVWSPNLIFATPDGNFVNPSWHVQRLFGENRGTEVLSMSVSTRSFDMADRRCAAISASAVRDAEGVVIVKAVNCSSVPQRVRISLKNGRIAAGTKETFADVGPDRCESPADCERLHTMTSAANVAGGLVDEMLPSLSLTVYRLREGD